MIMNGSDFSTYSKTYLKRLYACFNDDIILSIENLAENLKTAWIEGRQVFICGNGGSAANALHITNDFHYGVGACGNPPKINGLKVEALSANPAIVTCLANDTGYENIYSEQLKVKSNRQDILIVLSGSGNSPNVVEALKTAKELGLKTYAILAFNGGSCIDLADVSIHFPIEDMQIAEDTQIIIGHLCMQWLNTHKPTSMETPK